MSRKPTHEAVADWLAMNGYKCLSAEQVADQFSVSVLKVISLLAPGVAAGRLGMIDGFTGEIDGEPYDDERVWFLRGSQFESNFADRIAPQPKAARKSFDPAQPWGKSKAAGRLPKPPANLLQGLTLLKDEAPPTKGARTIGQDALLAYYAGMEVGTSFVLDYSPASFKRAATTFNKESGGSVTIGKDSSGQMRVWRVS